MTSTIDMKWINPSVVWRAVLLGGAVLFSMLAQSQDAQLMDGMGNINTDVLNADTPASALYDKKCAQCHDNPVGRIPPKASMRYRAPEGVYQALLPGGVMSPMTAGLSDDELKSLVKLLTGREPREIPDPRESLCVEGSPPSVAAEDDWSSTHGDIEGRRFRNVAGINATSIDRLKLKWAYAYPGGASGAATIAGNTLYLAGTGYVVALNASSGCVEWAHPAPGRTVRAVTLAAVSDAEKAGKSLPSSIAVFGDDSNTVFGLDASSGAELWRTSIAGHILSRITAAPTVYNNVVYVAISSMEDPLTHDKNHFCCTARGGIAALELHSGKLLWKKDHIDSPLISLSEASSHHADDGKDESLGSEHDSEQFKKGPAGASTYTPLTIDSKRGVVYATTAEEYGFTGAPGPYSTIAYDLKSGNRVWQTQLMPEAKERASICEKLETDCRNLFSTGTSALLHTLGDSKDVLLVAQKSGAVHGLDPANGGKILWTTQVSEGGDLGGVMYGMSSDGEKVYVPIADVDSPKGLFTGALAALDPATGKIVWRTPPPKPACNWNRENCITGQVAAVTVVSDMVFAGFWDGYVRVYATDDGRLLKEIDTAIDFKAVNGVASGGQVSGYPVTVGKDALYITSGASSILKSGNALLVYTLDGK